MDGRYRALEYRKQRIVRRVQLCILKYLIENMVAKLFYNLKSTSKFLGSS